MPLSPVIELFIQWGGVGEYHISLDYQVTLSVWSFFPISSRKKTFLPGKKNFFLWGGEDNLFTRKKSKPGFEQHSIRVLGWALHKP